MKVLIIIIIIIGSCVWTIYNFGCSVQQNKVRGIIFFTCWINRLSTNILMRWHIGYVLLSLFDHHKVRERKQCPIALDEIILTL